MREGETKKWKRLVFTVMADEREPDRFCLVAHLSSFSPLSGFFRDAPISVLSFSGHNPLFLNHHMIAPHLHLIPTTSVGIFLVLLSEFLLIIHWFASHV